MHDTSKCSWDPHISDWLDDHPWIWWAVGLTSLGVILLCCLVGCCCCRIAGSSTRKESRASSKKRTSKKSQAQRIPPVQGAPQIVVVTDQHYPQYPQAAYPAQPAPYAPQYAPAPQYAETEPRLLQAWLVTSNAAFIFKFSCHIPWNGLWQIVQVKSNPSEIGDS